MVNEVEIKGMKEYATHTVNQCQRCHKPPYLTCITITTPTDNSKYPTILSEEFRLGCSTCVQVASKISEEDCVDLWNRST